MTSPNMKNLNPAKSPFSPIADGDQYRIDLGNIQIESVAREMAFGEFRDMLTARGPNSLTIAEWNIFTPWQTRAPDVISVEKQNDLFLKLIQAWHENERFVR